MMIEAIIFDLGGILVPEAGNKIPHDMANFLNIPQNKFDEITFPFKPQLTTGEMNLHTMYSHLIQTEHLTLAASEATAKHLEIYKQLCSKKDERIISLVETLKKKYLVAALTNTEPEIAEFNRFNGLFDSFPKAYISTELGLRKPQKEIYFRVINDLDCTPEKAVFTDDNPDYIEGAKKAGLNTILYKGFGYLVKDLELLGVNTR